MLQIQFDGLTITNMIRDLWSHPKYKPRGPRKLLRLRPLLLVFGMLSGFGSLVAACLAGYYIHEAGKFDLDALGKMPERTMVYDVKGRLIGRLHGMNRIMIPLERSSRFFIDALLAREDTNFFRHGGVDYRGVARAVVRNLKDGDFVQGASTISMQLARNSYGMTQKTLHRKLLEVALTLRIEKHVSKNRILELYINRIFFGSGLYGLERASQAYLGKPAAGLNLGEAAMLAGIIRSPNRFSPFRNLSGALKERDQVLARMQAVGILTGAEVQAGKAAHIEIHPEPTVTWQENYAMDYVRRELDSRYLINLNEEYKEDGGLKVYTTIDQDLQLAAETAMAKHLDAVEALPTYAGPTYSNYSATWTENSELLTPYLQGAVVVLNNDTGGVLSLVGGRDFSQSKFNRALHARRQVGSVFKPFVYAAAYERGLMPEALIDDNRIQPYELDHYKIQRWSPRNSDHTYLGLQEAQVGLVKSRNTMTVRVGEHAGLEQVLDMARKAYLGKTAPESPVTYIGGFESPLLDLTSAYTSLANEGVRSQAHIIAKIVDRGGNSMTIPVRSGHQIPMMMPGTASLITDGLKEVMRSGTGSSAKRLGWDAPAAGKTGTTDDYRDAWFLGYTSRLTCGVWVGLDNNESTMSGGYGSKLALPIWVELMKQARDQGYAAEDLSAGPERGLVKVCRHSSDLATEHCRSSGTSRDMSIPIDLISGRPLCQVHQGHWSRPDPNFDRRRSQIPLPTLPQQKESGRQNLLDRFLGFLR